jgi:hypothetical protein
LLYSPPRTLTQADFDAIAADLKGRPRQSLIARVLVWTGLTRFAHRDVQVG